MNAILPRLSSERITRDPSTGSRALAADTRATTARLSTAKRLAHVTGLLYLIIAALGMFAGTVSASFVAQGNAGATAHNVLTSPALYRWSVIAWIILLVADGAVAVTLFLLLKPFSTTLSLLAAAIRTAYVAWETSPSLASVLSPPVSSRCRRRSANWGWPSGC